MSEGEVPVESPPPAEPRTWRPDRHGRIKLLGIAALAAASIIAILAAWDLPPFGMGVERTENAYVRGRTTVISPQVSGYVVAVLVKDFESVRQGQVLVRVDDRIYRARVDQARASLSAQRAALANSDQAHAARLAALNSQRAALAGALAQLERARADMKRADELVSDGSVSQREFDQTRAVLRQAQEQVRQAQASIESAKQDVRTVEVGRGGLLAQVDAAAAQLRLAQIDLGNTEIRAAEAGQVGEVGVRLGQYVTNGSQLLALVPDDLWIVANYKEAQTARIAPGQPASFVVDALDGQRFRGHVERLAPAAGSEFAVLKPDNATGNFVKIPQRVGVRIRIDPGQEMLGRLRPGLSVEARVYTDD